MPALPPLVHLVDADRPPDRLFAAVLSRGDRVLKGRFGSRLNRLRAGVRLRQAAPERVVCWSDHACRVGVASGVRFVFHRPRPHEVHQHGRAVPLAHGPTQARRMGGVVVPQPAVAAPGDRPGDGVFRWMLSPDDTPGGGLDVAVWAATLMYVLMRREGRPHRFLLAPGDAPRLRAARRFADQLGLPAMIEATHNLTPEQVAARCDAALLTPIGPCDPWPARLAAAAGLPVVATRSRTLRDVLGDRVREAESSLPRHVARAMLRQAESIARPTPATDQGVAEAREAWARALDPVGAAAPHR